MKPTSAQPSDAAPSGDLVRRFARVVMRPGERVLLLHDDNTSDDWVGLDDAIKRGSAFTVVYRHDLLVFDADRPDGIEVLQSIAESMSAQDGLRPVVWASGRPGHCQLVVRVVLPGQYEEWTATAKAGGIDVRTISRPPLSPHRLRLPVYLVAPEDPAEALEALQPPWMVHGGQRLAERTWRRLKFGDDTRPSGSEVVFEIAMGMLAKGWGRERAFRALMTPENRGGECLRRRVLADRRRGRLWFDGVWAQAARRLRSSPPVEAPEDPVQTRADLAGMLEEANLHPWPTTTVGEAVDGSPVRVTGTAVRRCLEGLIYLAIRAASTTPYASERVLLDCTGIGSRNTVRKALTALEQMGWVGLIRRGAGTEASTYRLITKGTRKNDPQEHTA